MLNGRDVIYLYDGSFDGLLSAVFESYYHREIPIGIEENQKIQQGLFCDYRTVITDEEKARRVSESVKNKISPRALKNIYYAYLSDAPDKGRVCLDYIRAGYKLGKNVDSYLTIDCVTAMLNAGHRARTEAHQYIEFIRFSELSGGVFYSEIEPKCHVLPLIAPHFQRRLSNMPWIIHDINRKLCMVYNGKYCYMAPTDGAPDVTYSEDEIQYRKLWKKFYDTIEIKQRHNEKCRLTHMPKRFWKHMTEMM